MWLISLQLSLIEGRERLEQLQCCRCQQVEAVEPAPAAVPGELCAEHLVLQPGSQAVGCGCLTT